MIDPIDSLKNRYEGRDAFDVWDPSFRQIVELLAPDADSRSRWAFDQTATFLDLPYLPRERWSEIDVGIVGMPIDLGVTHRAGCRYGPRALRNTERVGPYEHVLKIAPLIEITAADLGDVIFRDRFNLSVVHEDIENFVNELKQNNVLPLMVGGDHSLTLPVLRTLGREKPVCLIQFDAHCDTAGLFYGNQHHGSPFRQAVLEGLIDPTSSFQIGIRGPDEYFWEFSRESGMTVIHAEEVFSAGPDAIIAQIRSVVTDRPVYITVDIDSLDPVFAPGTGTPEVNGLYPRELFSLLRGLSGVNIVGGDVMEVAPEFDPTSNTAQLAGQILFTLLCLTALAR